jgi:hypothetical protein
MTEEGKAPTISIQASGFPLASFKEWDESCKKDFGDCRWVKIIHDHNVAKASAALNLILERLSILESRLEQIELNPQEEPVEDEEPTVKTLGGELK